MSHELQNSHVYCPYCAERLEVLLDPSELGQTYTEDCQVCCQPILFSLQGDQDQLWAEVRREDD